MKKTYLSRATPTRETPSQCRPLRKRSLLHTPANFGLISPICPSPSERVRSAAPAQRSAGRAALGDPASLQRSADQSLIETIACSCRTNEPRPPPILPHSLPSLANRGAIQKMQNALRRFSRTNCRSNILVVELLLPAKNEIVRERSGRARLRATNPKHCPYLRTLYL